MLQAIAAEVNLPETAFVVPAHGDADFELRWFSPTVEVALCGHATLAAGHVLLADRPGPVRFRTRQAGILDVAPSGDGYALALPNRTARPTPLPEVVAALQLDPSAVVATLWHERGYAVVVLADERAVRAVAPDFRALAGLGNWLVIVTAPGERTDIVSRAFAPGAGVDEDPVTGSAHAVIAAYWADRLGRTGFTALQASGRGGLLQVTFGAERTILAGRCVTVIEGWLTLPEPA